MGNGALRNGLMREELVIIIRRAWIRYQIRSIRRSLPQAPCAHDTERHICWSCSYLLTHGFLLASRADADPKEEP